jgi:hypothetical protein
MNPSLHRYYRLLPPPTTVADSGYAQNAPLTDLAHAILHAFMALLELLWKK